MKISTDGLESEFKPIRLIIEIEDLNELKSMYARIALSSGDVNMVMDSHLGYPEVRACRRAQLEELEYVLKELYEKSI